MLGRLHERSAAGRFDGFQAHRAVVQRAGEDHASHARPKGGGGRAKKRVHGRPDAVLARPVPQAQLALLDEQVAPRRGP